MRLPPVFIRLYTWTLIWTDMDIALHKHSGHINILLNPDEDLRNKLRHVKIVGMNTLPVDLGNSVSPGVGLDAVLADQEGLSRLAETLKALMPKRHEDNGCARGADAPRASHSPRLTKRARHNRKRYICDSLEKTAGRRLESGRRHPQFERMKQQK